MSVLFVVDLKVPLFIFGQETSLSHSIKLQSLVSAGEVRFIFLRSCGPRRTFPVAPFVGLTVSVVE